MADIPIDAQTLKDLPQGALETLLSTARAETAAAVAFVALHRSDGSFAITTSMDEEAAWQGNSLAALARSIWLDPDLTVGKVLVSSARVDGGRMKRRQAHMASVVLSDAATSDLEWGLLSIIAHPDRKFSDEQVDRIVALSKNLAAYLSARERMIDDLVEDEQGSRRPDVAVHVEDAGPDLEDFITVAGNDDDVDSLRARAQDKVRPTFEEPDPEPDLEDLIEARRSDEAGREFDDLSTRVGTNGIRDLPVRTVAAEQNDEVHVIPEPPDEEVHDIHAVKEGGDSAPAPPPRRPRAAAPAAAELSWDEEPPVNPVANLMMQVAEPGVVAHIADAMDAIVNSVEYVALIHLKIAYDDMATTVPTEAARVLVANSIKECVRFEDKVSRVGENSFVVVARLHPGSPEPAVIERRLVKAARRATGWTNADPDFQTDHLILDSDGIDDPEDVLVALLRP